jgi:AmmeMemoRadiSam system protein A
VTLMTDTNDRQTLLKIARDAVTAHVGGATRLGGPERPAPRGELADGLASRRGGAFVTIHHRGELRGCIGHIEADQLLVRVVAQCAVSACSTDPRFAPVVMDELPDIDVEMSLLGPLEPISGPADIEIGRHGLLVSRGGRRGLLLPQVAAEWRWDAVTFLAQTCRKAGLPAGAWKEGAAIWRFEAEVFGEPLRP